jgi:ABC-type antimicrobial peptide transport system permease subunit
MAEEIEHDPSLPATVEAIHMPEPSYLPIVLAFGLMMSLVGILLGIAIVILGLIIVIVCLVRWIRSARAEMAELPLDHGH